MADMNERLAKVAEWFHRELGVERCDRHGTNVVPACENWARQIAPLLAEWQTEDRAEAWDEGARAQADALEKWYEPTSVERMYWPDVPNPYRAEEDDRG